MKKKIDWKKQNKIWEKRYGELVCELQDQFHGIEMGMDGFSFPNIYMKLDNFLYKSCNRWLYFDEFNKPIK